MSRGPLGASRPSLPGARTVARIQHPRPEGTQQGRAREEPVPSITENHALSQPEFFVGIDVAQPHLDVAIAGEDAVWRVSYDAAGLTELCARLAAAAPPPFSDVLAFMRQTLWRRTPLFHMSPFPTDSQKLAQRPPPPIMDALCYTA